MNQPMYKDYFSGVAESYQKYRPCYPVSLFDHLLTLIDARDIAWDCGTGSGQAAIRLAQFFNKVIATDASAEQIASAEQHPRVEYMNVPAEHSGLPDQCIDMVTVAQALHWFDLPAFYSEVKRVVKPGGILAVWTYGKMKLELPELRSVIGHFYHDVVGPYWPPEREQVDDKYQSIPFPFEEISAPSFTIESALVLEELAGYIYTWSATQNYISTLKKDPVPELVNQLQKVWEEPEFPLTFRWPISLKIGRVQ